MQDTSSPFFQKAKNFLSRYPALVAGLVIYLYFLITTLDFYDHLKEANLGIFDYIKQFDTLLWMWLLAWVMIKILNYRTQVQEQAKAKFEQEQQLKSKQVQLAAIQEVVKKLQHDLNNPITILLAYLRRAERSAKDSPETLKNLQEATSAAQRIFNALAEFSKSRIYEPEQTIDETRTTYENTRRMDEAGSPRG
ncbi:MAG TPA: histidine kinase dimerization/phospho-acceptor domain-containing protein [Bacteroidota bacterium]|nr:histidine kinase dimerization/phospho-acceptor domain-containing protein [Bacteroidota bacterium]